ncbi:MAG: SpoIIE family protein phosphatase, partial [Treponema sp.]|nr:SpoIIE family protein phosphatase [Treponema sp.]
VNNILCDNNDAGMFATAFMGYYNLETGCFTYVNAGHNPPLAKKSGSTYEFLTSKPGLVLGCTRDAVYNEEEITLGRGDVIFLFTDGVTEAMNAGKVLFSEERLHEALNKYNDYPPKDLLFAVKQEIDLFAGGVEQTDDITMLALKVSAGKELKIEASVEKLREVIDFINAELERVDCPPGIRNQIDGAVDEIFVNIAQYAYKPAGGSAVINITAGEEVVIRFEDTGVPYNPLEHADPDLDEPLMQHKIGGLGIFLVKNLMDTVEYRRVENKNILTMTKKIQKFL